jgi:hypothetical protein
MLFELMINDSIASVQHSQFSLFDHNGLCQKEPLVPQDWHAIQSKSKLLWIIGKEQSAKQFDNTTAQHGVRDRISRQLVDNLHGPDKDDWKKEIDQLEKDNITREKLFNPFMRLKGMSLDLISLRG